VSLIYIYTSTLILKPLGQPISVGGSGPEFRSQIGAQTEKLRKFASFQEINALSEGTGEGYIYRGKSRALPTFLHTVLYLRTDSQIDLTHVSNVHFRLLA
jgi:hypothetical protein